jgi:isoleucyl-tRNA synthetase
MPEVGLSRISGMLKLRPDWCLSRQRTWGTPIPIVYCAACGKPVTSNEVLVSIEQRVAREGTDFWFAEEADKLVPKGTACADCGGSKFRKETDILDVWMDSGCSWLGVLKGDGLYPAQLYLEGSDQHRGWFQSSLVISAAMEGRPPFEAVLTHGFVLDEQGRAMHKSLGNVVSPQAVIDKSGADVLRLWVALADVENDVRLSQKLLDGPIDMYRKVRNTLKYLLGNTFDFDPEKNAVPYEKLSEADRFILHTLAFLIHEVREDYRHFRFNKAMRAIADFCIYELSAFYLDSLKDRLYCSKSEDPSRRSGQTVLHNVLVSLTKLMAPILSFTAEETWQNLRKSLAERGSAVKLEESVFLGTFPDPHEAWFQSELELRWRRILGVRDRVNLELEQARKAGSIRSSLEAKVILGSNDPETDKFLKAAAGIWPDVFLVSQVDVGTDGNGAKSSSQRLVDAPIPHRVDETLKVTVEKAPGEKCARCWQIRTDVNKDSQLCGRCAAVLA